MKKLTFVFVAVLLLCASAQAMTVDQIIKLHQSGAGGDVIFTQLEKDAQPLSLSTDDLIRMKEAGLPDSLIKALILYEPAQQPVRSMKEIEASAVEENRPAPMVEAPKAEVELTVENRDVEDYHLVFLEGGVVEIRLKEEAGSVPVKAGGKTVLGMPAGRLSVRAENGGYVYNVDLKTGVNHSLAMQAVRREGANQLQLGVSENGRELTKAILHERWPVTPSVIAPSRVEVVERPAEKVVYREVPVEKVVYREVETPVVRYVSTPTVYYYSSYPSYNCTTYSTPYYSTTYCDSYPSYTKCTTYSSPYSSYTYCKTYPSYSYYSPCSSSGWSISVGYGSKSCYKGSYYGHYNKKGCWK